MLWCNAPNAHGRIFRDSMHEQEQHIFLRDKIKGPKLFARIRNAWFMHNMCTTKIHQLSSKFVGYP